MTRDLNFLAQNRSLRALQASALVAVVGCVAMTGFVLGGGGQRTATIAGTPAPSPSSTPESHASSQPKALGENAVNSLAQGIGADTVRYYEQVTGRAFAIDLRTEKVFTLSDQRLPGFVRSYWIPESDAVVSVFDAAKGASYRFFDYQTKENATIANGVSAVAPAPDGHRLAYLTTDTDASTVFVSAPDGASPQKIFETRAPVLQFSWPRSDTIAFSSKRTDRPGADLALLDLSGHLSVLMTNRENLEYLWSPDGTLLLFSYFVPEQGVSLWMRDMATGTEVPLGITTSAQKCAWHSDNATVTCGVPSKSSLTRDVPADRSATRDDVVTIDILTGAQTQNYSAVSAALIGIIDPIVSTSGNYFVFSNLFDQRLYELPL